MIKPITYEEIQEIEEQIKQKRLEIESLERIVEQYHLQMRDDSFLGQYAYTNEDEQKFGEPQPTAVYGDK